MRVFTQSPDRAAMPCEFVRLGSKVFDAEGNFRQKANVRVEPDAKPLTVDAASLYIDRNCTLPMLGQLQH